jgi:AcrR family transcriptional regulator
MRSARKPIEDLTARARIRDSAILYFGRHGFQSATVRAIAADAGVSPALVIHHFGSKDGLREVCDGYVTDCIDDLADHASTHLQATDLLDLMSRTPQLTPLVPYTIQAMTEGGEFAVRLWNRLVQDAEAYLRAAVAAGKVRPTTDERSRAEMLTTFKLGMYLLARYVVPASAEADQRDVDIAALAAKFTIPTLDLFTHGMFTTTEYLDAFVEHERRNAPGLVTKGSHGSDSAEDGSAGNGSAGPANGSAGNGSAANGSPGNGAAEWVSPSPEPVKRASPPTPVTPPEASQTVISNSTHARPAAIFSVKSPLEERHEP